MFRALASCVVAGLCAGLPACTSSSPVAPAPAASVEIEVQRIPLAGPAAHRDAELSGLAWFAEHLVLLPQIPRQVVSTGDGVLLAIPKSTLIDHIEGRATAPITPREIPLSAPGLFDQIPGEQGFEAIAFAGRQVFMIVEAAESTRMAAYLVKGEIAPDLGAIVLDTGKVAKISAQADVPNASDEAMLIAGDRVLTFYEANGAGINPAPKAHVFTRDLEPMGTIPFPHIEYRVSDATDPDASGQFWITNYFYPGDRAAYRPVVDPIAAKYGRGPAQAGSEVVERLLLARYGAAGITLADQPPIVLRVGAVGRNWEGLARLDDRGFILVTDKFPETILAFAPMPGRR